MLLCLHVEFVFMLMPFTWLTDDLLKDNPTSKLRLSISAAQICLFCEKYEKVRKPENPGNSSSMRRQKSPLFHEVYTPALSQTSPGQRIKKERLGTRLVRQVF